MALFLKIYNMPAGAKTYYLTWVEFRISDNEYGKEETLWEIATGNKKSTMTVVLSRCPSPNNFSTHNQSIGKRRWCDVWCRHMTNEHGFTQLGFLYGSGVVMGSDSDMPRLLISFRSVFLIKLVPSGPLLRVSSSELLTRPSVQHYWSGAPQEAVGWVCFNKEMIIKLT